MDPNDPLLKKLKTPDGVTLYDAYMKSVLKSGSGKILSPGLDPKTCSNELHLTGESDIKGVEAPKKASKLRNRIFKNNEGTWQSEWEYIIWLQLKDLQKHGVISQLRRQVEFRFEHNGVDIGASVLDYVFEHRGIPVYADAKSRYTSGAARWRFQRKLLHAFYGIERVLVFYKGEANAETALKNFFK